MSNIRFRSAAHRDFFLEMMNNEGGSVRPTVGVKLPWCQFAADRLATSHSISGCRGQIEMLPIIMPDTGRS